MEKKIPSCDIEIIAVSSVNLAVAKTDYFFPEITTMDKHMIFDGEIKVFNDSKKQKEDYMGSICLQCKGKTLRDSIELYTYDLDTVIIKKFATKPGVFFFVVGIDSSKQPTQIYYAAMKKTDLLQTIKRLRPSQQQKRVKLMKYPNSVKDQEKILGDFFADIYSALTTQDIHPTKPSEIKAQKELTLFLERNPYDYNSGIISFVGRQNLIDDLKRFALNKKPFKPFLWWGITGPGGAGKTRLAYEFVKQMETNEEWRIRWLQSQSNYDELRSVLGQEDYNELVIADYAGRHINELRDWMCGLCTRSSGNDKRIRVLLLERSIKDSVYWQKELLEIDEGNKLIDFQYAPICQLAPLKPDALQKIILEFAAYSKGTEGAKLSEAQIKEIIGKLERLDPEQKRPLFAMSLTEAFLINPEKTELAPEQGLLRFLNRELRFVRANVTGLVQRRNEPLTNVCMILLHIATVLGRDGWLPFDEFKELCKNTILWDILTENAEKRGVLAEEALLSNLGLLVDDKIPALQPDPLAEYAILNWLTKPRENYLYKIEVLPFFQVVLQNRSRTPEFFHRLYSGWKDTITSKKMWKQVVTLPHVGELDAAKAITASRILLEALRWCSDPEIIEDNIIKQLAIIKGLLDDASRENAQIYEVFADYDPQTDSNERKIEYYHEALRIFDNIGDEVAATPIRDKLAKEYRRIGNESEAERILNDSLRRRIR